MSFLQMLASGLIYVFKRLFYSQGGILNLAGGIQQAFPQASYRQAEQAAAKLLQSTEAGEAQADLGPQGILQAGSIPTVGGLVADYRYIVTLEFYDPSDNERYYRSIIVDSANRLTNDQIEAESERQAHEKYELGLGAAWSIPETADYVGYKIDHIFRAR